MIDHSTKETIKNELAKYVSHIGSDNKASKQMGVSNAYISQIKNSKWDNISDDMWRKVAALIGLKLDDQWQHADTRPYLAIRTIIQDARLHANVYALKCNPGGGKSYTLDATIKTERNVFFVKCNRHTTERDLLSDLLRSMRRNIINSRVTPMLQTVVNEVRKMEAPVFVFDEWEKVKWDVKMLFIDLYNALPKQVGMVLIGTQNSETLILRALERGKVGANELHSRVGGKFISIPAPNHDDAAKVIRANGISDPNTISYIINDSDNNLGEVDLRRVERLVHATKNEREAA